MRVAEHLNKTQINKLDKLKKCNPSKKKQSPKRKQEERVDWIDIMGTNRQTLKRGKGGAMRRN